MSSRSFRALVPLVLLLASAFTIGGCKRDCDEIERSAAALRERNAACESDADCIGANVEARCLPPFLCAVAVNRSADLGRLRERARELSEEYRDSCDTCVVADCAVTESSPVYCEPTISQCAFRPRN